MVCLDNYYYYCSHEFFTIVITCGLLMEYEWQQISKSFLNILANVNNAEVWMVLILSLISNSSKSFFQAFGDLSKCTNYTVLGVYFCSQARYKYLSIFCFLLFSLCGPPQSQNPFFFFWLKLGLSFSSCFFFFFQILISGTIPGGLPFPPSCA